MVATQKSYYWFRKKAKSSYAYNNQCGIYKNRYKSVIAYTKTSSKKQTEVVIKFTRSKF